MIKIRPFALASLAAAFIVTGCANDHAASTSTTAGESTTTVPTTEAQPSVPAAKRAEIADEIHTAYPETSLSIEEPAPGEFVVKTGLPATTRGLAANGICTLAVQTLASAGAPSSLNVEVQADGGSALARSTGTSGPICRPH